MNAVVGKTFKNQHLSKPTKANQIQSPRAAAVYRIADMLDKNNSAKASQIFCLLIGTPYGTQENKKRHIQHMSFHMNKNQKG